MEMADIVEESERGIIRERQDKLTTYRARQGGRFSVGRQDKVYIIKENVRRSKDRPTNEKRTNRRTK